MEKRYKDILRTLVDKLRHILVGTPTEHGFEPGNLDRELERIGIGQDGTVTPIDALPNPLHNGDGQIYRIAATQLNKLPERQRSAARQEIVERAAYTWINRLLALRAMEVRGLIEHTLRIEEVYGGISEKLYLLRLEEPQRASDADGGWWSVLQTACAELTGPLRGLFALDDPDAALHPTANALIQCIELVGGKQPVMPGVTLDELDAAFADPDTIGWAYQFYQEESKAAIDAKCKSGGKTMSRAELAAKTQLFTEPYMVQWLLQNSLGRSYHERYPHSQLPASWPYYIPPAQRGPQTRAERVFDLDELTLLDPCMGSGHFLRAAFDMFVAMYREQQPHMTAQQIADRVLDRHLFGIDLDPRAAQLSALTLYLRAWELVKEERGDADMSIYMPPEMHLATTPTNLDSGALERHFQRYPRDRALQELLENIFTGLEHADVLGSLLRSREYLDQAITNLQKPHTIQMDESPEVAEYRRDILERAKHEPGSLRQILFDTIAISFHSESNSSDDVSMALFGREAERGVRLLQILDNRYAVVATNPPYLGSSYMDTFLKSYVNTHYHPGKRDLYAAFILRCLELCRPAGRVAMVTMHSWMFLSSFTDLRALPEDKLKKAREAIDFRGLLRETSIEVLAQLGAHAFEEITGEVVQCVLFQILNIPPSKNHTITAFRLVGIETPTEKQIYLKNEHEGYLQKNENLTSLPNSPLGYWLSDNLLRVINNGNNIRHGAQTKAGLTTGESLRFYRKFWELEQRESWLPIANGGAYKKWFGHNLDFLRWGEDWKNILANKGNKLPSRDYYDTPSVVLSQSASGCLSARITQGQGFTNSSIAVFPIEPFTVYDISAFLNTHCASYLVRLYSQKMGIEAKHLDGLPLLLDKKCGEIAKILVSLKEKLVSSSLVEDTFKPTVISEDQSLAVIQLLIGEAFIEERILHLLELTSIHTEIEQTTGTPAGWYPLIAGYDTLEELDEVSELPLELYAYLEALERIQPDEQEMERIKAKLRVLYVAGPRANESKEEQEESGDKEGEKEAMSGAYIPIPTETFLEELSVKMQLHPISVYWLLEELRATEMLRCKPEEKRLLEDRLSVLVLRLLGHRWPRQIEAHEPLPAWADEDGIIPLVSGTGHRTLAERVRERLNAEEGALRTQEIETLLQELTGQDLEQWLRGTFFKQHISQFKKRPIAWHLASMPQRSNTGGKKKRGVARTPAFECILYYHACAGDALARIRTQYVEPLLKSERGKVDTTMLFAEDTASSFTQERIQELEAFVNQLRAIEERGFACQELREIASEEVLDRWSGNGYEPPADRDAFLRGEEAWRADINDGVRVNIAPLQLAGVLAKEVLNGKDARKALADRVRWRVDERRWVREGKLPRCGWMDESVPASPAWTAIQAERTTAGKQETQQAMLLDEDKPKSQEEARS